MSQRFLLGDLVKVAAAAGLPGDEWAARVSAPLANLVEGRYAARRDADGGGPGRAPQGARRADQALARSGWQRTRAGLLAALRGRHPAARDVVVVHRLEAAAAGRPGRIRGQGSPHGRAPGVAGQASLRRPQDRGLGSQLPCRPGGRRDRRPVAGPHAALPDLSADGRGGPRRARRADVHRRDARLSGPIRHGGQPADRTSGSRAPAPWRTSSTAPACRTPSSTSAGPAACPDGCASPWSRVRWGTRRCGPHGGGCSTPSSSSTGWRPARSPSRGPRRG